MPAASCRSPTVWGEHIGRYIGLIECLVYAGLVVYGNDHRGHGRTAPSPEFFGDFGPSGFDLLVHQLSRIAKSEQPGRQRAAVCGAPTCSGSEGNWRHWLSRATQILETC